MVDGGDQVTEGRWWEVGPVADGIWRERGGGRRMVGKVRNLRRIIDGRRWGAGGGCVVGEQTVGRTGW